MRSKSRLAATLAHLLRGLADNGKRRRGELCQVEVVESGEGEIVGNSHAEARNRAQNITRRQRIRSEDRRRRIVAFELCL